MAYSIRSLFLKIWHDVFDRLKKPTKDNWWAVGFVALGIAGSAHSHHGSWQAMWGNAWDTLVLPWGLGFCFVLFLSIWKSARAVYREETVSFPNALHGITKQPPWHFRWRCYLVGVICLSVPTVAAYNIWQKSNPEEEPLLYLQPDTVPSSDKGDFPLYLVNSGPDIEYIGTHYDYFVAKRKDNDIVIYRTFRVVRDPAPNARPLRTNQRAEILPPINFSPYMKSLYNSLAASEYDSVLQGVRLIVTFRRYSDGKSYRKVWSYACTRKTGSAECNFVYAPGTPFDQPGPPGMAVVSLHDIVLYMESNEHWVDPVVEMPSFTVKEVKPLQ